MQINIKNTSFFLSFLILDFLKAEKVLKNIEGILSQKIFQTKQIHIQIIVIDNSCSLENEKILREGIKKIQEKQKMKYYQQNISSNIILNISKKNIGYTRGNNLGNKFISKNSQYLFVVNPDIVWIHSDTVEKLVEYMEKNPEVGLVAPRQKNLFTGERELSVRKFPNLFLQIVRRTVFKNFPLLKNLVKHDEMQFLDDSKTQDVDWIQSSFVVIQKKLWDEIGGFNEDYFLFMADTEICRESWKRGKKVKFFSKTEVGSDGIRCSDGGIRKFIKSWVLQQHLKDAIQYFFNHLFETNPRKFSKGTSE